MSVVRFGGAVDLMTTTSTGDPGFRVAAEMMLGGTGRIDAGVHVDAQGRGTRFRQGDVLFGKLRPYLAKSWVADRPGEALGDIHVYRPRPHVEPRYLGYVVLSDRFLSDVNATTYGTKMPRASWDTIKTVPTYLPAPAAQIRIADYLDRETATIDTLIEKQRQLVAGLESRKLSLVEMAVTRGLDPTTLASPSRIAWLRGALVPAIWSRPPLGALVGFNSGQTITSEAIEPEGDFPVYGGNGLRGYTDAWTHEGERLLVGRQGALCGNVHLVDGRYWASEHALVSTVRSTFEARWLKYMLQLMNLGQYSMASAQPGIAAGSIIRLRVPTPPLDEQRAIADHLDAETAKIDALIAKAERFIELAQERRAALITAAVTGQIEIPEAGAAA